MSETVRRQLPNRSARRADTLRVLAEAAQVCVGDDVTFADLSVERLSRQAGISRATFYLYFEDKGELVRGWHHALDTRLDHILAEWWSTNMPSREQISHVLSTLADAYCSQRFEVTAIQEISALDPDLRQARDDAFRRRAADLRKHMVRGQRAGWVDGALDASSTAPWLVAMVDRVMQRVMSDAGIERALIETGADVIWHTLYSAAVHP